MCTRNLDEVETEPRLGDRPAELDGDGRIVQSSDAGRDAATSGNTIAPSECPTNTTRSLRSRCLDGQSRRDEGLPARPLRMCATAQKRQRVAPPGAIVETAVAVWASRRYTNHGGGPADGALYSAVSALPVSSTRAGHPSAAQRAAIAVTVSGSVTRTAVPSTTRSKSWAATLSAHRGSRARFLPLRVRLPVSNQKEPSTQRAPSPVTWGLPLALMVVSQQVCRSGPPEPGACGIPSSSRALIWDQSTGGRS
jgi:hypothetical protein